VPKNATADTIKVAYRKQAKQLHPDVDGGSHGTMAQLNMCYEALTQRRAEYDAKKGIAHGRARRSTYNAGSWWSADESARQPRSNGRRRDAFEDFFVDWEETFYGGPRQSWQQWADEWRTEARNERPRATRESAGRSRRRWRKEARASQEFTGDDRYNSGLTESSSDDDDDDEAGGRFSRKRSKKESTKRDTPAQLWLTVVSRGRSQIAEGMTGSYNHLGPFNGRPSFEKLGKRRYYLFWSSQFRDWKISERMSDDGVCAAFAEDGNGRRYPWQMRRALQWSVWDPEARAYCYKRLRFEPAGPMESSDEQSAKAHEEGSSEEATPWSRAPWEDWSVQDLLRWCKRHDLDVSGCFDRESVLERVQAAAAQQSGTGRSGEAAQQSGTGRSSEAARKVQIASRMKTDGSFTRPPLLDPRASIFGNRVETFRGREGQIIDWLKMCGDKSRLYGIYLDGDYSYSIVWKRNKQWGRLLAY